MDPFFRRCNYLPFTPSFQALPQGDTRHFSYRTSKAPEICSVQLIKACVHILLASVPKNTFLTVFNHFFNFENKTCISKGAVLCKGNKHLNVSQRTQIYGSLQRALHEIDCKICITIEYKNISFLCPTSSNYKLATTKLVNYYSYMVNTNHIKI